MKHRKFASAVLISSDGRILIQQRDNIPSIRHPGKLGLFGGQLEGDESSSDCLRREIAEEIGYAMEPDAYEKLADYSAVDPDGCKVSGAFYIVRGVPIGALSVTEGTLIIIDYFELPTLLHRFEPAARTAMRLYLSKRAE